MSELVENIQEALEKARESRLNTMVAAFVALTATFMAISNVKSGNVVQGMTKAQTESMRIVFAADKAGFRPR